MIRPLVIATGLLLAWQLLVWVTGVPFFSLPGPGRVLAALITHHDLLLRHALGLEGEAQCVELAVSRALEAGVFTADLASDRSRAVGTRAVTAAVLEQLELPCHVMELRD